MKKIITSVLALAMSMSMLTPIVKAETLSPSIYADVNHIEIDFGSTDISSATVSGITLSGENAENAAITRDGNVVTITPLSGKFEVDSDYRLTVPENFVSGSSEIGKFVRIKEILNTAAETFTIDSIRSLSSGNIAFDGSKVFLFAGERLQTVNGIRDYTMNFDYAPLYWDDTGAGTVLPNMYQPWRVYGDGTNTAIVSYHNLRLHVSEANNTSSFTQIGTKALTVGRLYREDKETKDFSSIEMTKDNFNDMQYLEGGSSLKTGCYQKDLATENLTITKRVRDSATAGNVNLEMTFATGVGTASERSATAVRTVASGAAAVTGAFGASSWFDTIMMDNLQITVPLIADLDDAIDLNPSIYADTNHFEIDFGDTDITGASLSRIELFGENTENATVTRSGNIVKITPASGKFDTESQYILVVKPGFLFTSNKVAKCVKIEEILNTATETFTLDSIKSLSRGNIAFDGSKIFLFAGERLQTVSGIRDYTMNFDYAPLYWDDVSKGTDFPSRYQPWKVYGDDTNTAYLYNGNGNYLHLSETNSNDSGFKRFGSVKLTVGYLYRANKETKDFSSIGMTKDNFDAMQYLTASQGSNGVISYSLKTGCYQKDLPTEALSITKRVKNSATAGKVDLEMTFTAGYGEATAVRTVNDDAAAVTGAFAASYNEAIMMDNLQITTAVVSDCADFEIIDMKFENGNSETIESIQGENSVTANVTYYSNSNKNIFAVIAAYAAGESEILSSNAVCFESSEGEADDIELNISINNNTVKCKVFIWENLNYKALSSFCEISR